MRSSFGSVRRLPSRKDTARKKYGRFQARYKGLDGGDYKAPSTFATKLEAEAWLANERRLMDLGQWQPPEERLKQQEADSERAGRTVGSYFDEFIERPGRSSTTKATYKSVFNNGIREKLGDIALEKVTRQDINDWWAWLWKKYPDRKSRNADSYTLLATVFNAAISDEYIAVSPCKIPNGGKKPDPVHKELLTQAQIEAIIAELPEHYRLAALVAGACGLRIGEWTGLRRKDVQVELANSGEVSRAWLYITKQARRNPDTGKIELAETKARRNRRVSVPSSVAPLLVEHVRGKSDDELVFPNKAGTFIKRQRFNTALKTAGAVIGRGDVSSHDFRHFGGTTYAQAGATLAESMDRLGHSTVDTALRYQHATEQRATELADRMALPSMVNVHSISEHKARKARRAQGA
ncbi:tyrosine-type recombinase/integrase [Corynebacterium resistens]